MKLTWNQYQNSSVPSIVPPAMTRKTAVRAVATQGSAPIRPIQRQSTWARARWAASIQKV
ncbi:MAG: hypothetical protein ABSC16_01135 [Candidatus Dormibacteria bacterium]|nr:hypothetical protein [Chloroflexota bacterium]HBV93849.1 hypothetical protein [Chloroflexota bacterium]